MRNDLLTARGQAEVREERLCQRLAVGERRGERREELAQPGRVDLRGESRGGSVFGGRFQGYHL